MPNNSSLGLDAIQKAWDDAELSLAGDSEGAATPGKADTSKVLEPEQPNADEAQDEEDVDLLSILDDSLDQGEGGQPNNEDPTFTVEGQSVPLSELKAGYLRQSDYTKKTQELAKQREDLENAKALWDQINEAPVETVRMLADNFNMGRPLLSGNGFQGKVQSESTDIERLVREQVQAALGNNDSIKQIEEKAQADAINSQFRAIEEDYSVTLSNRDKERVLQKAQALNVQNAEGLRLVFAGMLQEAQRAKAAKDALVKSTSVKGGSNSGGGREVSRTPQKFESFWDAAQAALKDWKGE